MTKKNDQLRLVFDCRPANERCKTPPKTYLATPGAICNLHFPDGPQSPSFSAIYLVDSFYLFLWTKLAELFALDVVVYAGEVDTSQVYDPDLGRSCAVAPDEPLYACLSTLPIGWSWSLYFCHDVTTECMPAAEVRRGVPREIAEQGVLRDHRAPPHLADNGVTCAVR